MEILEVLELINGIGLVSVIGGVVWLIRLEGKVKHNSEELTRLAGIEKQTAEQEVRISKRDEEMKSLKRSLDEVKDRMEKLENRQMGTAEQLSRMDTKLDILVQERSK